MRIPSGISDAHPDLQAGRDETGDDTPQLMDMLLAKKRAADRKSWLEKKGDLAAV